MLTINVFNEYLVHVNVNISRQIKPWNYSVVSKESQWFFNKKSESHLWKLLTIDFERKKVTFLSQTRCNYEKSTYRNFLISKICCLQGYFSPLSFFGWWIKPYVVYVSNFSIYLCMCSWFWKQQQNCKKKTS